MIVSIGDTCVDHYVTTDQKHVGGIATNFAVHVKRLGEEVALLSAVGDQQNGAIALKQLAGEGVDTDHVVTLPGSTAMQKIKLNGNEREFCGFSSGILEQWHLNDDQRATMRNASAVVIPLTDGLKHVFDEVLDTSLPETALRVVDFSRDADVPGFNHGDVSAMLQHYLDRIDIAFIGGDESLIDDIRSIAASKPDTIVVLTLGAKGAMTFHDNAEIKKPAIWVKDLVDTTGCGDAFRAGFVVEYLRSHNIEQAMDAGSELAAKTASYMGAF